MHTYIYMIKQRLFRDQLLFIFFVLSLCACVRACMRARARACVCVYVFHKKCAISIFVRESFIELTNVSNLIFNDIRM